MTIDQQPTNRSFLGDGFVPYQLVVTISNPSQKKPAFDEAVKRLKGTKSFLRNRSNPPSVEQLVEHLMETEGVTNVVHEGALSSILVPLIMIHSLTEATSTFSTVLGTGPIADRIFDSIQNHGIRIRPTRLHDCDSPIELSCHDDAGNRKTLRLYPGSQTRYRSTFRPDATTLSEINGFVLTRYNAGRGKFFRQIHSLDQGFTSLRVAAPTRFVAIDDYADLLSMADHVVISHRDGALQKLARHVGLVSRSTTWGKQFNATTAQFVRLLSEHCQPSCPQLVVLALEDEFVLLAQNGKAYRFQPPSEYDQRSRAARVQGAAAAFTDQAPKGSPIADADPWRTWCNRVVQACFQGTEARPTRYPKQDFRPTGDWCFAIEDIVN